MRDLTTEAGILSGSLYHHFTSKEEMVREVLTKARSGEAAAYRQIFYSWPNADEALRRSTRFAVNRVAENPDVARIFRNDAQYIRETPALADSEERRQSNRVVWLEIVEAGITQGHFRPDLVGAGSSAVMASNLMQRYWRNAHAVRLRAGSDYDVSKLRHGRVPLGLTPTPDLRSPSTNIQHCIDGSL